MNATSLLASYARAGRSGEFICSSLAVEVHVYLQRGRVAWATDSNHPFVFARHLKEASVIDDDSFRHVLDECRKDHLPLGETLVAWGLARWEDVLGALRHQMHVALVALAGMRTDDVGTIFLERRGFAEYDERLTIELATLVEDMAVAPPESAPAVTVTDTCSAASVLASIRGARWTQLVDDGEAIDHAGGSADDALPPIVATVLDDGADFVALRWPEGSLLGVKLEPPRRRLWCELSADANYGSAVAAVATVSPTRRARVRGSGRGRAAISWEAGDSKSAAARELRHVVEHGSADILAAGLVDATGELVTAIGTTELGRAELEATALRRRAALGESNLGRSGRLEALGFRYRTIVTGEPTIWCFGAENFGGRTEPTLWVFVRRQAPQGVGWACLTTLSRTLFAGERSKS